MKKIRKKALMMAIVIVFGFVSSALMAASTYARDITGTSIAPYADSYYATSGSNPRTLQIAQMYYKAAERCLTGGSMNSTAVSLSGPRTQDKIEDALGFYNLDSSTMFWHNDGNKNSSGTLYSAILENMAKGGYDNGTIYCDEVDVFSELLQMIGRYDDRGSELICNGKNPGIFKITTGYGNEGTALINKTNDDNNILTYWPSGIGNGEDCSSNLKFFLDYVDRPNETVPDSSGEEGGGGLAFYVKFEVSKNAADFFRKYMNSNLGVETQLSNDTKNAIQYWTYYRTFNTACESITSGSIEKPLASSGNMIGIYDASNNATYYHSLSNLQSKKATYYTVINKNKITCEELAKDMSSGSDLVNAVNQEKIKGCIDAYNTARQKWYEYERKYYKVSLATSSFVSAVDNAISGIEGRGLIYNSESSSRAKSELSSSLSNWLSTITNGIDGTAVVDNATFSSLKSEMDDILSKTDINSSGKVTGTSATSEQIKSAKELLEKAKQEKNSVSDNETKLSNLLENHPRYSEDEAENPKSSIWNTEDGVITCPGETELINSFKALDLPNSPDVNASYNSDDYNFVSESGDGDPCYNAGVEGISWILCPAMNNMANTVDSITGNLLESWLSFDSEYYNDTSGAKEAWGYFRDVANVAMIVILLVIIVSQLTGYGIDNFGIKKMLPKLITMAILINLSFYICQLAIDVSNIFGNGLRDIFESIGLTMYGGKGIKEGVGDIIALLFSAAGLAGAGASAGITIIGLATLGNTAGTAMIVITIVLMLIPALLAVLMFFLTLGARFVVILVFTAIAPLALACYILPNTQSLYKKWFNIYKIALFVYPICGALYGASYVIKAIVFGSGEVPFWMALIAIAAPYLPFLLLPELLKGLLGMLGKLGGTLSTIGSGLKRGLSQGSSAIMNSKAYKSKQEEAGRNMDFRMAGLKRNEKGEWVENDKIKGLRKAIRGGKVGMAAAKRRALSHQAAIADEESLSENFGNRMEAERIAQVKKADAENISNWETRIKSETNDGANEKVLFDLYDGYVKSGNVHAARAVARIAGRRKDTAESFLKEKVQTNLSGQNKDVVKAVAKEIAEGTNSGNYLTSSPLGFDFASSINKGEETGLSYNDWLSPDTFERAMERYVTNSSQLVGLKSGSLDDIIKQMKSGNIDPTIVTGLRNLATETIANRDKGPWDVSKAKQYCEMSGGAFKYVDGNIIDMRGGSSSSSTSGGTTSAGSATGDGIATEGGVFNVNAGTTAAGRMKQIKSTNEEVRRMEEMFDSQRPPRTGN